MASSFPSRPVYDQTSNEFTAVGLHFLRSYFARNPRPNDNELKELEKQCGCEIRKLRGSFASMRQYDKRKQEKKANSNDTTTTAHAWSLESLPPESPELSTAIEFLNTISRDQAGDFFKKIKTKGGYKLLMNPKHVGVEIPVEEIGLLSSVTPEDGN
ncbi:unnamed protein product [Rotaria sordida]|uniref:Uncharacterized protein n=1 Tax=Rotaria sordida TaxID=392033 RepID=A0A815REX7_9BILA|nr:unnamed protein product [Rotaria sordida]CAF4139894.1 unnamed protein product [Rotaria sordida]